jgi:predicted RNA-binding protein with PUA-like domain
MAVKYWLIKSEPGEYSYGDLVKDKREMWNGVRNFQARNNLRAMKKGDLALFYHSVNEKRVVGIAKVVGEAYPDPTVKADAKTKDWSVVDFAPVKAMNEPVDLATLKADPALAEMIIVKHSRLSVAPVTAAEFKHVLKLGKTKV